MLSNLIALSLAKKYSPVESTVRVDGFVSVRRGGAVDLVQVLSFRPEFLPVPSVCRVASLASSNKACGRVSPDIFDCGTYSGPIVYQHLGCYAPVELAMFMISALPVNYSTSSRHGISSSSASGVYATSFTVEVHVTAVHPLIRQISVKTVLADPVSRPGVLNMTIKFPPALVDRSKYEVVAGWEEFQFPVSGSLSGTLNQPLPGGLVPVVPWTYRPHKSGQLEETDYILIKVYTRRISGVSSVSDSQSYYSLLSFGTNGTQATSSRGASELVSLGRDLLVIRQALTTPVSAGDFSEFNLTRELGIGSQPGLRPSLKFMYPVFPLGSFQSVSSSIKNVSHTSFTDLDLLNGHVAFHPTDIQSSSPVTFSYNVTTIAGVLVASGAMAVQSLVRDWSYPSQRTNSPLPVAEGGVASITCEFLDFYLLKPCDEETILRVLSPPQHGSLMYANDSPVGNEQLPFLATSDSSFLLYQHSGDETLFDVIHWEVWCPTGPSQSLVSHVLVAALDNSHPVLKPIPELSASQGLPVLLSSAMFQASDVDSALSQITIRAHHSQGSSLRMESTQQPCLKQAWPVPSSQCLLAQGRDLIEFTSLDLEDLKVWYVPDVQTSLNVVELTVADPFREGPELYNLYVVVSSSPPNFLLEISTSDPYPQVLRNRPLPLHHSDPVFITPYFLFSQAPPLTASNVRYHLETPPTGGYICHSSGSCSDNLDTFTQLQLSQRKVIYRPHNNSRSTSHNFTFVLSVSNFFPSNNISHVFQLVPPLPQVITAAVPLVVEVGKVRTFSASHFRTYAHLLQTSQINFTVSRPPQFGWLALHRLTVDGENKTVMVGQHFSFSYLDVERGRLSYRSSLRRGSEVCVDEMEVECASASGSLRGVVQVVLRASEAGGLSVVVRPHTLVASTTFKLTTEDVSVRGPYCTQWVKFSLLVPPSLGHLVVEEDTCLTERLLVKGSLFTAQDIQEGAVAYHLSSSLSVNETLEDVFHFQLIYPSSLSSPLWSNLTEEDQEVHNGSSSVSIFTVHIPQSGQAYELELAVASEFPLTWLPEQQSYGYTFHSPDVVSLNSSLPLRGVLLQLDMLSVWGSLQVGHAPVAAFTLADLTTGKVSFIKNKGFHDGLHGEQLEVGVYAHLPTVVERAQTLHMKMIWHAWRLQGWEGFSLGIH